MRGGVLGVNCIQAWHQKGAEEPKEGSWIFPGISENVSEVV